MEKSSQFKPLTKVKISERVEDEIKKEIMNGNIRVGDRLPSEKELSNQFNVSRSTVREAINSLSKLGVLEVKRGPGQGAFVVGNLPKMSSENLELFMSMNEVPLCDLIEVRLILESATAELAAIRADEKHLKMIEKALSVSDERHGDIKDLIQSSYDFHLAVSFAAKNRVVEYFAETTRDLLRKSIETNISLRPKPIESFHEHKRIFLAIKNRKPDQARRLMEKHLENYRSRIEKVLKD